MKKASRILALVMALAMVFSLTAFASGDPSGAPSGEAPAASAAPTAPATKNTSDVSGMKASEYEYLTNYTNRKTPGDIYVGETVTASGEIALDDTVTGAGYTAVYASGEMADATVTGTLVLTDDSDGQKVSDFSGQGAAFVAYDAAKLTLDGVNYYSDGFERAAIVISQNANVMVKSSQLTVMGADPLTEAWDGYHSSADQNYMISPPWPLGVTGGARVLNMIGTTPTLTIIDSELTGGRTWGLLSTDSGSNMVINLVDTTLTALPESKGGSDSGWRIFGYDEDAYGSAYGSYYIGGPTQNYYGVTFNGVTYAAIITGAQAGHYASSNGAIDLYDAQGNKLETVQGKGQPTVINGVFGFMQHNAISDGLYIEDGTIINAADAVIIYKAANGDYYFDNAQLNSQKGVLFQMIDNDDDSRIGGMPMAVDPGFDENYSDSKISAAPGFPGITYAYESKSGGNTVTATYTNGTYTGNIYNGTGYYSQAGDNLSVTIGTGATLTGDIALTSTVKGVKYSAAAMEGIKFYGDDIQYVLLDAAGKITTNEAQAAYINITDYTINEYFLQGHVENMNHYNGTSTVSVLVANGGVWTVAEESLITNLTVEAGAKVYGALTVNADGTLTLVPAATELAAGTYGTIKAAAGSGENVGGGVTNDGTLDVAAAAAAIAVDDASGEASR